MFNAAGMKYLAHKTGPFKKWLRKLDAVTQWRIFARIDTAAASGHFGDHKPLGGGLFEMRFNFGCGYRVYYGFWRGLMLLLLLGGDKSGQDADIDRARAILAKTVRQLDEKAQHEQDNRQ